MYVALSTTSSLSHADDVTYVACLLQNGDPPLHKSNAQLKLFDGTLMKPVGETTLTAERNFKLLSVPTNPCYQLRRVSNWGF